MSIKNNKQQVGQKEPKTEPKMAREKGFKNGYFLDIATQRNLTTIKTITNNKQTCEPS